MGGSFSRTRKVKAIVVGLDNSGKTTIVQQLKPQSKRTEDIAPTVGFRIDQFTKGNVSFSVWDMSGANRYRDIWQKYYKEADACIFVVDSSDKLRLAVAKDELEQMLKHPDFHKRISILVLANKQDLPTALLPAEIATSLQLDLLCREHSWIIIPTSAITGEGLSQGTSWLAEQANRD